MPVNGVQLMLGEFPGTVALDKFYRIDGEDNTTEVKLRDFIFG